MENKTNNINAIRDSYTNPRVIERYTFYKSDKGNKIIAVTKENGRTFSATATCSPEDKYDEEVGRKLAFLRCEQKVKRARLKAAMEDTDWVQSRLIHWTERLDKAEDEENFCCLLLAKVSRELEDFTKENHLYRED